MLIIWSEVVDCVGSSLAGRKLNIVVVAIFLVLFVFLVSAVGKAHLVVRLIYIIMLNSINDNILSS